MKQVLIPLSLFPIEALARYGYHHHNGSSGLIMGGFWLILIGSWIGKGKGALLFIILLCL